MAYPWCLREPVDLTWTHRSRECWSSTMKDLIQKENGVKTSTNQWELRLAERFLCPRRLHFVRVALLLLVRWPPRESLVLTALQVSGGTRATFSGTPT